MAYRFHNTMDVGVDVCKVHSLIQKIILDTNTASLSHPPALHMTTWNLAEEIVKNVHRNGICGPKSYALCRTYDLNFAVVQLAEGAGEPVEGQAADTHEIIFSYSGDKNKANMNHEHVCNTSCQPGAKKARLR